MWYMTAITVTVSPKVKARWGMVWGLNRIHGKVAEV